MGRIETHQPYGYDQGLVVTQFGYVSVYAQGGGASKGTHHTSLHFMWRGREYTRYIAKRHSKRGIVTLADRFASEIAKGRK
jgi:hypothetical protein